MNNLLKAEQKLIEGIMSPAFSDFKWLVRILLLALRFAWRHRPIPNEGSSKEVIATPTGPYALTRSREMGDLLLWVPRRIDSFIIDDLTGRYGYSHITVDTGEVDLPTGKPVMVETTVGQVVERIFQDRYGGRAYARIPLSKTGIDAEVFVDCIKSRLGEPYDYLEALTLGEIDDPAKQICSSLASDCLPETVRREIAKARRLRLLRRASVSVHSSSGEPKTKVFISPNGFANYYGVPKGEKLRTTNVRVEPQPMDTSIKGVAHKHGWKTVQVLGAAGLLTAVTWHLTHKYFEPGDHLHQSRTQAVHDHVCSKFP